MYIYKYLFLSTRIEVALYLILRFMILIHVITIIYIYYYWYSAFGPVWAETRAQSGDCIMSKFLGVACHCFPRFLDVPTFHHQVPARPPRRERSQRRMWEMWVKMLSNNFAEMISTPFRDLLHAANL